MNRSRIYCLDRQFRETCLVKKLKSLTDVLENCTLKSTVVGCRLNMDEYIKLNYGILKLFYYTPC